MSFTASPYEFERLTRSLLTGDAHKHPQDRI